MAKGDLILRLKAQGFAGTKRRLTGVNKQLRTMGRVSKAASAQMSGLASAAAGFIAPAIAIAAAGRAAIKSVQAFADFGRAVKLVGLISGSTAEQTAKLGKAAKELAPQLGKTPIEIVGAFQALASAGLKTNQVILAGSDVMKLSILRFGDLNETARLVAKTLQQFNIPAEKTQEVVSRMATTISTRLLNNVNELGEAMRTAGAEGSAFGQSLKSTLAVVGLLQDVTGDAANTGIAFRKIMTSLAKETPTVTKALAKLGIRYKDVDTTVHDVVDIMNRFSQAQVKSSVLAKATLDIFQRRFGGKIKKAIDLNRDSVHTLNVSLQQQEETLNRVGDEWGTFMEGIRAEIDRTSVSWSLFKLSLGKKLAPEAKKGLGELQLFLDSAADLLKPEKTQKKRLVKPFLESAGDLARLFAPSSGAKAGAFIATRGPGPAIARALASRQRGRSTAVTGFEESHPGKKVGGFGLDEPVTINNFGDVRMEKTLDLAITEQGQ